MKNTGGAERWSREQEKKIEKHYRNTEPRGNLAAEGEQQFRAWQVRKGPPLLLLLTV